MSKSILQSLIQKAVMASKNISRMIRPPQNVVVAISAFNYLIDDDFYLWPQLKSIIQQNLWSERIQSIHSVLLALDSNKANRFLSYLNDQQLQSEETPQVNQHAQSQFDQIIALVKYLQEYMIQNKINKDNKQDCKSKISCQNQQIKKDQILVNQTQKNVLIDKTNKQVLQQVTIRKKSSHFNQESKSNTFHKQNDSFNHRSELLDCRRKLILNDSIDNWKVNLETSTADFQQPCNDQINANKSLNCIKLNRGYNNSSLKNLSVKPEKEKVKKLPSKADLYNLISKNQNQSRRVEKMVNQIEYLAQKEAQKKKLFDIKLRMEDDLKRQKMFRTNRNSYDLSEQSNQNQFSMDPEYTSLMENYKITQKQVLEKKRSLSKILNNINRSSSQSFIVGSDRIYIQ